MNRTGDFISVPGVVTARPGIDAFGIYEDFIGMDVASDLIPGWTATHNGHVTTDSTVALLSEVGGGIQLAILSPATDGEGIVLCMDGSPFEPTARTIIEFETKLRIDGCDGSPSINFCTGLCKPASTDMIQTAGALKDVRNAIFVSSADGFAQLDANSTTAASTTDARKTKVGTLVDDTFITLGIIIEGTTTLRFLINGKDVHRTTTATEMPTGTLTPVFGILADGTTLPQLEIKYVSCWQTFA